MREHEDENVLRFRSSDSVAHQITALKVEIDKLSSRVETGEDAVRGIAEMRRDLDSMTSEIRTLMAFIRGRVDLFGLLVTVLLAVNIWGIPEMVQDLASGFKDPEVVKAVGAIATVVAGFFLARKKD